MIADEYYKPLTAIVGKEEAGKQVRTVLERQLGVSRKLLSQVKLTEFGITVNEKRAYTSAIVAEGDIIKVRMLRETSDDILPQPLPFEILFEDEDLLIVNKPAGIIVHPTHGHYTNTLANAVVYHWQQNGEKVRFRPIHRLDEETSGIVAIAKTSYVHQQLSEQLQAGKVSKLYRAFVYGVPQNDSGTIDAPIDRDEIDTYLRVVTPPGHGYPSVTHYEVDAIYSGHSCSVRLKLETGRTHQIRVHMRHIGCPLIGDKLYGLKEAGNPLWEGAAGRQALHAEQLGFTHPITKKYMVWTAPLPLELAQLEKLLSSQ